MNRQSQRDVAFEAALVTAGELLARGDAAAALSALERAHVLGQADFFQHLRVHLRMLRLAINARDGREVRGQVLRIALVPLGHAFGRLPRGNTGRSNVSPFAPMPVSSDLAQLLDDAAS